MRNRKLSRVAGISLVLVVGMVAAACSSTPKAATTTTTSATSGLPKITATSFTSDFSVMTSLKSLAAEGHGMVGALLPDTTSSARYVSFDAPYLTQAFQKAGLTSSQIQDRQRPGQ